MKLYAQHGYGPADKMTTGLHLGVIDGVIFGAKEAPPNSVEDLMQSCIAENDDADILFDPQYYVTQVPSNSGNRLGYIEDYGLWSGALRNEIFLRDQNNISSDIRRVLALQASLPVTTLISPNILVRRSLDSRSGAIAENFINLTHAVKDDVSDKPVLCTLAITSEAINETAEVQRLSNSLAALENRPDGFYLLISTSDHLYQPRILGNILMLIYSLKLNGYEVVWGYSDILGTTGGCVGLDASATGWHGTLRTFSLDRFGPSPGGGQRPRTKFLSKRLMNRILLGELVSASYFRADILNGLVTDAPFINGTRVIEPSSETAKCLQSWGALKSLQEEFATTDDLDADLTRLSEYANEADATYQTLGSVSFETASSGRNLSAISDAVDYLRQQL